MAEREIFFSRVAVEGGGNQIEIVRRHKVVAVLGKGVDSPQRALYLGGIGARANGLRGGGGGRGNG